jgi:hypothetical protein
MSLKRKDKTVTKNFKLPYDSFIVVYLFHDLIYSFYGKKGEILFNIVRDYVNKEKAITFINCNKLRHGVGFCPENFIKLGTTITFAKTSNKELAKEYCRIKKSIEIQTMLAMTKMPQLPTEALIKLGELCVDDLIKVCLGDCNEGECDCNERDSEHDEDEYFF